MIVVMVAALLETRWHTLLYVNNYCSIVIQFTILLSVVHVQNTEDHRVYIS